MPVLLVILFFECQLYLMPNSYSFKKHILEKNMDTQILILGTSHELTGINPAFLSKKTINLANSDQPLYIDYKILDQNLSRLKNLETVIIPVSYFSLETKMADTPEYWREFFYERYFNIPPETSQHLFDMKRFSLLALYGQRESMLFAMKLFHQSQGINGVIGAIKDNGFQPSETGRSVLNETAGKNSVAGHESMMKANNINANASYLTSMIRELGQRNIKAVLITTPVTPYYYDHINPQTYDRMQQVLHDISFKYQVPYLNYMEDQRFNISDFSDTNHLNPDGAEKFTKILNSYLKKTNQ